MAAHASIYRAGDEQEEGSCPERNFDIWVLASGGRGEVVKQDGIQGLG